ncbi:MAG: metallophosphoesterase family protein [Vicinamibacterales bacterium]
MRIAALYDIHANLPALDAVLAELRRERVDEIIVGGDVLPGPMPCETLALLSSLQAPVKFIHGNGELAVLAQIEAADPSSVTYWGTTSGNPPPESVKETFRWTAAQISSGCGPLLRWPRTYRRTIDGIGEVLFCHATPHSETDCFTRLTREDALAPVFNTVDAALVVCGHTHMQFDRVVAGVRVVNAGSVGMPFGKPGADWLILGPDVELRHTDYDFEEAAAQARATTYPQARELAESIVKPPSEAAMLDIFTALSFP